MLTGSIYWLAFSAKIYLGLKLLHALAKKKNQYNKMLTFSLKGFSVS
jgi:hypothetical protein